MIKGPEPPKTYDDDNDDCTACKDPKEKAQMEHQAKAQGDPDPCPDPKPTEPPTKTTSSGAAAI